MHNIYPCKRTNEIITIFEISSENWTVKTMIKRFKMVASAKYFYYNKWGWKVFLYVLNEEGTCYVPLIMK